MFQNTWNSDSLKKSQNTIKSSQNVPVGKNPIQPVKLVEVHVFTRSALWDLVGVLFWAWAAVELLLSWTWCCHADGKREGMYKREIDFFILWYFKYLYEDIVLYEENIVSLLSILCISHDKDNVGVLINHF